MDASLDAKQILRLLGDRRRTNTWRKLQTDAPIRSLADALSMTSDQDFQQVLCGVIGYRFKSAKSAVPALIACAESKSEAVRSAAFDSLGKIRDERAREMFEAHYRSETKAVLRANALAGLVSTRHPAAAHYVLQAINDSSWNVRHAAIWGVGELKVPDVKQILHKAASSDPDESVRSIAEHSLSILDAQQ